MLLELILEPLWLLVDMIVGLFPKFTSSVFNFLESSEILKIGLYFLPVGFWGHFITSVTFWLTANFSWAVIEWVYKKIPGVN